MKTKIFVAVLILVSVFGIGYVYFSDSGYAKYRSMQSELDSLNVTVKTLEMKIRY